MNYRIIKAFNSFYGKRDQVLTDLLIELSPSDYFLLFNISEYLNENKQDFIYVSKIAEIQDISVPAVSKVLRKLEENKYIKRTIDMFCRRNTKVKLTPSGLKILEQNNKIVEELVEDILAKVSEEKIYQALDVKNEVEKIIKDRSEQKC